jgi:phospholipase/lecithinase/hemolysin
VIGTWTNGPVAVSYLNDLLSLGPSGLKDYSQGGCCGGGSYGATLDPTYTPASAAKAPALSEQIANFTSSGAPSAKQSLGFIWAGQNDLSAHTDAFWLGDPHNADFAAQLAALTIASVAKLLGAGVPYVLVANVYPKHLAPVTAKYLCGAAANACVTTWGQVIGQANAALKSGLAKFGGRVIYYDSFGFLTGLLADASAHGFTKPLTSFCDGNGDAAWKDCMVDGHAPEYFWMNFVQPTTRVHQLIATDMMKTVRAHFGL